MKTKICSGKHGCGHELPLDKFHIRKSPYKIKSGETVVKFYPKPICIECERKRGTYYRRKKGIKEHHRPLYFTTGLKVCTHCNEELPLSEFHVSKGYPHPRCKGCDRERNRKWEENNHDRKLELQRDWYKNNRKRAIGFVKRYMSNPANRKKYLDKYKSYRESLTDSYVRTCIRNTNKSIDPTPEMIEIKRFTIIIKRLIKQENHEQLSESK